jgi:hypothetical protein
MMKSDRPLEAANPVGVDGIAAMGLLSHPFLVKDEST